MQDLWPILMAPLSQVSCGLGDYSPSTKVPSVTFGGSRSGSVHGVRAAGYSGVDPDPKGVRDKAHCQEIRRAGAFAHIEIPWAADWHQSDPTGRPGRVVSLGSLTRSPLGLTVTSCSSYTDELVMGRVSEAFSKNLSGIRMGDSVWLRSGTDHLPNDR